MVIAPDSSRVILGGSFTPLSGQAAFGMGSISTPPPARSCPGRRTRPSGRRRTNGAITTLKTDGTADLRHRLLLRHPTPTSRAPSPPTRRPGPSHWSTTATATPTTSLPVGQVLYTVGHAHDCTAVGSFPDTNPRVAWQHALAFTIAPTGTNVGPDVYGWDFNGQPAPTLLDWFPYAHGRHLHRPGPGRLVARRQRRLRRLRAASSPRSTASPSRV